VQPQDTHTDSPPTTDPRRTIPDDLDADQQPAGMIVKPTRFVANLTRSIKSDLKKLEGLHRRTLALCCDIGDKLTRLKTELGHGEWGWWITNNFGMTDRTARRYMEVAANRTRVSEMPAETSLRGAIALLRAERLAQRTRRAEQGDSYTAEQLERRSRQQTLNATRRVWEQVPDMLHNDMADLRLGPEQLWPDDEREQARQMQAMREVAALAARLGGSDSHTQDAQIQPLVEVLRQQIADAPPEVLQAVWDDQAAGAALASAEWHYRRPMHEQFEHSKQVARQVHETAMLMAPGLSNSDYMFKVAARIRRYAGHLVQLKYWIETSPNLMDEAMHASRADAGQALHDLIHIATETAALLPTYLTPQPDRPDRPDRPPRPVESDEQQEEVW